MLAALREKYLENSLENKQKNLIFLVGMFSITSVNAAEQTFMDVCSLRESADRVLTVKVISGMDACEGKKCFAAIYDGYQVGKTGLRLGVKSISFATSAAIQIGARYTIFAKKITPEARAITFLGAGYQEQYEVPERVDYYVPLDGAFLMSGTDYFRTVWQGCEGEAKECDVLKGLAADVLKADVLVEEFNLADECGSAQ